MTNTVQKEDLNDSKTDSALIPTYPPLPRVEYVSEESVIMIPTQAKLKGTHAGYLFIPIDGEIYRYQSADGPISNTTASELFYEFSEDNEFGEHDEWKIYALRDYPNHERLLGKCNGMEEIVFEYAPPQKIPESCIDEAIENGFVMMKNGSVMCGKERWLDFYKKTQAGQSCSIRLGFCYTNENANESDDMREATKEDYPQLFLKELCFDGTQYTIRPVNKVNGEFAICEVPGKDSPERTFSYLMHYVGEPQSASTLIKSYDKYVLTNNNRVTWEDITAGMLSSSGGSVVHDVVFSEYEWK